MERAGHAAVLSAVSRVAAVENALEQQLISNAMGILPVAAAAFVAIDSHGGLRVIASSGDRARLLAPAQLDLHNEAGREAFRSGRPINVDDLGPDSKQWPASANEPGDCPYQSAVVLPLSLDDEPVGALVLFHAGPGPISPADAAIGEALARVAAVGMLYQRTSRQLQTALDTRVIIEQAKGVLAERASIDVLQAFTLLRSHARRTQQRLTDLAGAVVEGADTTAMLQQDHTDVRSSKKQAARGSGRLS